MSGFLGTQFQTGSNKVAGPPHCVGKLNFPFHFDVILTEIVCFQYIRLKSTLPINTIKLLFPREL